MLLKCKDVSLIDPNSDDKAYAGLNLNPLVRWMKFVLTDDKPNANGNRIPREEFPNLIRTGHYMPIKTAEMNGPERRHFNARPIGTITHLKIEDDKILGLAALWETEHPEDVKEIVKRFENGEQIDLSWEIAYTDSEIEEDGTEVLKGTALLGTTIVDIPAYQGRTPVLSVAEDTVESEKWSRKYINDLPDSAFLYIEPGGKKDDEGKTTPRRLRHLPYKDKDGKIDRAHLVNAIQRLSQENTGKGWLTEELRKKLLEKAKKLLEKLKEESEMEEEKLAEALNKIQELEDKLKEYEAELESLRAYKEEVERREAEIARFKAIKEKFIEAGIEKPDEYFEENREKLLAMSEDALDFMLQEMVAALAELKEKAKETDEGERQTSAGVFDVPTGNRVDDPVERARLLIRGK